MAVITLTPTKYYPSYKRLTATGGTAVSCVTDGSDSTYVKKSADGTPTARYSLSTLTPPAGTDIATVVPCCRMSQATATPPRHLRIAMSIGKLTKIKKETKFVVTNGPLLRIGAAVATPTSYEIPASAGSQVGPAGAWKGDLKNLGLIIADGHSNADTNGKAVIRELSAKAYVCTRPTPSITSVATASTSCPVITASYQAQVESWQDNIGHASASDLKYELKVFTAAQVAAPKFSITKTPPIFEVSGTTPPLDVGAASVEIVDIETDPLAIGNYVAYTRASRTFTSAVYSAWVSRSFSVAPTTPPAPSLSSSIAADGASATLTFTAALQSGASLPEAIIQRRKSGDSTWYEVRGSRSLAVDGTTQTLIDYEPERGAAIEYRAAYVSTISGFRVLSAYGSSSLAAIPCTGWALKALQESPVISILGANVLADPEWTQDGEVAVLRPVGRKMPVVVTGASAGGADGTLTLYVGPTDGWDQVEALRNSVGLVLLQSPYGWQRYVKLIQRSWTESGAPSSARRLLTVGFVEAGFDLSTEVG